MLRQNGTATQTVSQEITGKLTRRIFDRVYPAGSKLPTERDLAVEFGVTRHVVREALKRLEAVGLVRIRQGSGIHVESLHISGNIDVFDYVLTQDDGTVNLPMLRDVIEFRSLMVRVVVRLAAVRRTDEQMRQIKEVFAEWMASSENRERREELSLRLFQCVAEATQNRIFVIIFNTLGHLFIKLRNLVDIPLMGFQETESLLARIVETFENKDQDMADLLVTRYLETMQQLLKIKEEGGEGPGTEG
jgi:GntR family transcriptional regulator, transcriptional repressor for pyruvate dehydrogenase complex